MCRRSLQLNSKVTYAQILMRRCPTLSCLFVFSCGDMLVMVQGVLRTVQALCSDPRLKTVRLRHTALITAFQSFARYQIYLIFRMTRYWSCIQVLKTIPSVVLYSICWPGICSWCWLMACHSCKEKEKERTTRRCHMLGKTLQSLFWSCAIWRILWYPSNWAWPQYTWCAFVRKVCLSKFCPVWMSVIAYEFRQALCTMSSYSCWVFL